LINIPREFENEFADLIRGNLGAQNIAGDIKIFGKSVGDRHADNGWRKGEDDALAHDKLLDLDPGYAQWEVFEFSAMKHAVLTAVAVLLIAVPTAAQAETYPANIQKAFMSGCQTSFVASLKKQGITGKDGAAQPICSCLLTKISAKMRLTDFEQASIGLINKQAGKPLDASTQKKVGMFNAVNSTAVPQCVKSVKI